MNVLKYVRFDNNEILLFPKVMVHRDVANGYCRGKPVSAGFCYFNENEGKWEVYGRSESLDLDSNPKDTNLLDNGGW